MSNYHLPDSGEANITCEQLEALLPAFLEQGLPSGDRALVKAHLQQCARCRHRWQNELTLMTRLEKELQDGRTVPATAATWRMRHQLDHRLRRERLMFRTKQTVWGTLALAAFLTIFGAFVWWQAGDSLTTEGNGTPGATPESTLVGTFDEQQTPVSEQLSHIESTGPAQEPQDDRIVVQFALYDFLEQDYTDLIAEFEAQNPDIDIRVVYIQDILALSSAGAGWPDDAVEQLAAAADVSHFFTGPAMAARGLILDLRPFIEGDPTMDEQDFYPSTLQGYEWQGGIWGIPTDVIFNLMAYNKGLFDEAGVPYPRPGWTWDEFLEAATALTQPGEQWGLVMPIATSAELIEARGGPLWDTQSVPPRFRLDDPAVIEAARWYANLFLVHKVAPYQPVPAADATGAFTPPGQELIWAGQAAMWPETSSGWGAQKRGLKNRDIEAGIAPFPVTSDEDHSTPVNTANGLGISAGSRNPEAAWRWISFLSSQPIGNRRDDAETSTMLPARRSVAEASGFWDQIDPELAEALRFALEHSYDRDRLPVSFTSGADILEPMMAEIVSGATPVEVALASAQAQLEALLAEEQLVRQEGTPVPPVAPPEPERMLLEGKVQIRFVAQLAGSSGRRALQELVEQFEEANPDIFVDLNIPNSNTAPSDLARQAASFDCLLWNDPYLWAETREALISLEPFLDVSGINRDDFYGPALAPYTVEGELWGLPASINVPVLAYNRQLFDAAGLPYPTAGWTPEQFEQAAIALAQGEGEQRQYGFAAQVYEPDDLLLMLERYGANLVEDSANPVFSTFDDPTVVSAVAAYSALATEYEARPLFTTEIRGFRSASERDTLLQQGRVAMWTDYAAEHALGRGGENVGYVPMPAASGATSPGLQSTSAYFISAAASEQARNACWNWIAFLSEQPQAVEAGLPARRSVAQSDAYRQMVGEERADAYLGTVENSTMPAFMTRVRTEAGWNWLSVGWFWLADAYHQVVTEGVPVEVALQEAQETANAFRSCLIASDATESCLRDVDPELANDFFGSSGE